MPQVTPDGMALAQHFIDAELSALGMVVGAPVYVDGTKKAPPLDEQEDDDAGGTCLGAIVRAAATLLRLGTTAEEAPLLRSGSSFSPRCRAPLLPPRASKHEGLLTVVFDLDETLVFNRLGPGLMIKRPFVNKLLGTLSGMCEMVLWTASRADVGTPAVRQLSSGIGGQPVFDHVIYRDDRWFQSEEAPYTKDLRRLGRDMSKTVVVENTVNCVRLNPAHAIMVNDFCGNELEEDATLLPLLEVLKELCSTDAAVPDALRDHPLLRARDATDASTGLPLKLRQVRSEPPCKEQDSVDSLLSPLVQMFREDPMVQ